MPSYRFEKIPKPYNEALLKKTNLTLKENKDTMESLGLY